MQFGDITIFVIITAILAVAVRLRLRQYKTAYHLPLALEENPDKRVLIIKCIASLDGLPPYVDGYQAGHAGFNFTHDGIYVVFLRGLKTTIEWFIPYGKIESFKRTGKLFIGIKIQHKQEGVPPVITMLHLGQRQSDRILAFLADKVRKND